MKLTQSVLEEWITTQATGTFHYTKVLDGQIDPQLYAQLRVMMSRCEEKGIAYRVGERDGYWRPADKHLDEICWWESEGITDDNILLPLNMNKYCKVPRPSVIIYAGSFNSGKTALCLNTVALNMEKWEHKLDFYVSEGAEMMRDKFDSLDGFIPKPPPFKMYRRMVNFSDVIHPNHLSVIDYLRVDMTKAYEVSNQIFSIYQKLENGIAVIAMQKPPGERNIAFGGVSTAFEPTLYVGIDSRKTEGKTTFTTSFEKIKIAKVLPYNPYLVKLKFQIRDGASIHDVNEEVG